MRFKNAKLQKNLLQIFALLLLFFTPSTASKAWAEKPPSKRATSKSLLPTMANVQYGPDKRNVLNFWKAKSDKPTPVVFMIHGGGWRTGHKAEKLSSRVYLDKGISVVSINYRFLKTDILPVPVHDAARALQFVRSKSKEWNLDKKRIAVTGSSAGGCTSLWLNYHDDLANPDSKDPVERESTKPWCAAVEAAQTCLEPNLTRKWCGDKILEHPMLWKAVGASSPQELMKNYEKYKKMSEEFSPYLHVDKNDPPVFLLYSNSTVTPAPNVSEAIHHTNMAIQLKKKADRVGAECHMLIRTSRGQRYYKASQAFLLEMLLNKK